MSDESDSLGRDAPWPTCPRCGSKVSVSGGGKKDCPECPWSFKPRTRKNTTQKGLTDY